LRERHRAFLFSHREDKMENSNGVFSAQDKLDIAERYRQEDFLKIGEANYPIRPLSGRGFLEVLKLVKESSGVLTSALMDALKGDVPTEERFGRALTNVIAASADQGEHLLKLMHFVLSRSTPGLKFDDMVDQMDFVADFERFWLIFVRQNKIDALQKKVMSMLRPLASQLKKQAVESLSLKSVTSSAGTTDGPSIPSLVEEQTASETTS
jgi:hypothetical protein